jgi:hypothetical protein
MTVPVAFQVAQGIGNNLSRAFTDVKDSNTIDRILQESMNGGPEELQNNIGKILSQVSPDRQGVAIQFLQNRMQGLEEKKQNEIKRAAEAKIGVTSGLHPTLQAQEMKERAKNDRLSQYGLGNTANISPDSAIQQSSLSPQSGGNVFSQMSEDQLILASGAQDREIAEPAKQEIRRRQQDAKANKSNFEPESEKLEAKRVADLATEIESEYKAAQNEDIRLERSEVLDKEGNVSAPLLVKALDALGLPIGILGNPATEEYRKIEADYVRDVSKVFPGGKITNYEVQSYLKTIPSLMNTPDGRKAIVRNRKLLNEAKKVRYDEYKKIIKENNGKKPPNLGILIDERTAEKINKIEDNFIKGINQESEKFQQPVRMVDPNGNPVDIPPNLIEKALQAGAKFR